MTPQEASQIAAIVAQADGGCLPCVSRLTKLLQRQFGEHDWCQLIAAQTSDLYFTETELRGSLADLYEELP